MRAIASGRIAIIAITFAGTLVADYRFVTVDYPRESSRPVLTAINNAGQIVGMADNSIFTFQTSFFADIQGRIRLSFQYPGVTDTYTSGIDSAGNVIGQFIDFSHGGNGTFLRSAAGAFTLLPLPSGLTFTSGQAISGNGAIVLSGNQSLFFPAPDGSYTSVLVPGAGSSANAANVTGIDNAGNVVGFYYTSGSAISFFRDAHGVFQTIQIPGAIATEIQGMNNLGQAVGSAYGGAASHGFLWRGRSDFTLIDYPGATSTFASGINDSGIIVGFYDDALGRHGLIAFPPGVTSPPAVPVPPSLWLALTGCAALIGFWFRWRRRLKEPSA